MRLQFIVRAVAAAVVAAGTAFVASSPASAADPVTVQYGHGVKLRQMHPHGTLRLRIGEPKPVPDSLLERDRPADGTLRYARVHATCARGACQLSPFYFQGWTRTGERYRAALRQVKDTIPTKSLGKGDQVVGNICFDVTHGRIRKLAFTDGLAALALWQRHV